jgi:Putative  PD-(D/E)XK family member, (DUF4420)
MRSLQELWLHLDLEAGSKANASERKLVRRRVFDHAPVPIYVAVASPDRNRLLLVDVPDAWNLAAGELPLWAGMEIAIWPEMDKPGRSLLVMRQLLPAHREVFETVVTDIADSVASTHRPDDARRMLLSALQKWQTFFDKHGTDGLSPELQQGLFGELCTLRSCTNSTLGPHQSLTAWTGGDRTTHDFQFVGGAIEVKTTRGKLPSKVRISNERQLDDSGLQMLLLVAVSLEVRKHGGQTLPELVSELRQGLVTDAQLATLFELPLLRYGYLDAHADHYSSAYFVEFTRSYKVRPTFPRLITSDLPNGLGDLAYSVSLSACSDFEVDLVPTLAHLAVVADRHG